MKLQSDIYAIIEMSPQKRKVLLKYLYILATFYSALLLSEPHMSITVSSATIKIRAEPEEIRKNHAGLQVESSDKYSTCGSKIIILNCDYSKLMSFSRSNVNKISSRYEPGSVCNIETISLDWVLISENETVRNLQDFHNMDTFLVEPYSLQSGYYQLVLYLKEYLGNGTENVLSDQCVFEIKEEQPPPMIANGSKMTIHNGQNFIFDVKKSIDPNTTSVDNKKLLSKKSCNGTETTQTEDCNDNLGYDLLLTVPMAYAQNGSNWQLRRQLLQLTNEKKRATYTGVCSLNCPPLVPVSDVEKDIVFKMICRTHCEDVDNVPEFRWTVDAPGFDYDRDTKFGRNSAIFHIKANVLPPDMVYNITVDVSGATMLGHGQIITHVGPKLNSCKMQPQTGYALKTQFYVSCNQPNQEQYTFKLYSITDDSEFLLITGTPLNTLELTLHENCIQVKVKIIDKYEFSDVQILDVTVLPGQVMIASDDLAKELEDKYFNTNVTNSITNLLKKNNSDDLLQVLNVLTEEISGVVENNETVDAIKQYQKKVLSILKNLLPDSKEMAKQIASVSSKIATQYELKSDPDMAELITDVCSDASKKYLDYIQKEKYPNMLADEIASSTKLFSGCSKATSGPNFEILETEDTVVVPTTPFPLVDFPMITEDYPDYVDDQNVSKLLTKDFETYTAIDDKSAYTKDEHTQIHYSH